MNYFQILALLKSGPRVFQTRNVLYLCICSTSIYFAKRSKSWVRLLRLRNCRPREPVELAEPTEPREMTVFTDNYLSNFSPADWSRPIVDNSTDHGNEVMVAQFVFSFPQAIFQEKSTARWTTKTVNVIVKTNGHQLSMVCTLLDHRNEVKMSKLYNETTLLRLVVPP